MSGRLSAVGAFAYLFNSFAAFTVFLIPQDFELWFVVLLVTFAVVSCCVSCLMLSATDLLLQEQVGTGPAAHLLPSAVDQRDVELGLPALVQKTLRRCWGGEYLYLAVLYCCVLAVADMTLVGADSLGHMKQLFANGWTDRNFVMVYYGLLAAFVSIMNTQDFTDLETCHMLLALLRVVYGVLRPFNKLKENNLNNAYWATPKAMAAFFYQFPLPGIMAVYQQPLRAQLMLQGAVISTNLTFTLLLSALIWYLPAQLANTELDSLKSLFEVVFFTSKLASAHIYWKSMSSTIVTWRYGVKVSTARDRSPTVVKGIEICVHWLAYLTYICFLSLVDDSNCVEYFIGFFIWIPFVTMFIYWSLAFGYNQLLGSFSEAELLTYQNILFPPIFAKTMQWGLALLCVMGACFLVLEVEKLWGSLQIFTGCAGLAVILAMVVWNVLARR